MRWSSTTRDSYNHPTIGTVAYRIARDNRLAEQERQIALEQLEILTRGYHIQEEIPPSILSRFMATLARYFNPSKIKQLLADLL